MFSSFKRRLTAHFVWLACVLIVVVAGTSTALAVVLYAHSVNDALANAAQRAVAEASQHVTGTTSLAQAAPEILNDIGNSRFHIAIFDRSHRLLAQNLRPASPHDRNRFVEALGSLFALPRERVAVRGGTMVIAADFDRFGGILLWYWAVVLVVGVIAVIAAWLIARRIAAQAIGPLREVTAALQTIAAGDFSPQRLPETTDLRDLTSAYNDVAYRLTSANAERLATQTQMRQFIADAGHELRTPLTVIMGYLDVLHQGVVQDREGTQRAYETMLEESRRMRTLIEKLIFLARLDRPATARASAPIDLPALVQRVADGLAPLAEGRIRLALPAQAVRVNGDESELYEAVKNIVENALKYSSAAPVDVSVAAQGDSVVIEIADQGPGMDEQDRAHAFDRFYRGSARAQIEGSGLGLPIARRAITRAGGAIEIGAVPTVGTCIRITLPAGEETAASFARS